MNLTNTSSPHIRGNFRTGRIMLDVVLALLPAWVVGMIMFGLRALLVGLVCMVTAVATEWLYSLISKNKNTVKDASALVTGLLLALTLPHTVPYWVAAVGSAFGILFVKLLFGGLGQNIFNPALTARALLMLIFPAAITRYEGVDGVTSATPLHDMVKPELPAESILDMFLGNCPGSIGEISALALLVGGAYLVYRKVISLRIPLAYIGTVAVITLIFPKAGTPIEWMLYSVCSGGLILGAVFMATDYTSSPITPVGQILYGVGCGVLTVIFRYFGLFPEGVTYAILLMNALVWIIDEHTAPRRFGTGKRGAAL